MARAPPTPAGTNRAPFGSVALGFVAWMSRRSPFVRIDHRYAAKPATSPRSAANHAVPDTPNHDTKMYSLDQMPSAAPRRPAAPTEADARPKPVLGAMCNVRSGADMPNGTPSTTSQTAAKTADATGHATEPARKMERHQGVA